MKLQLLNQSNITVGLQYLVYLQLKTIVPMRDASFVFGHVGHVGHVLRYWEFSYLAMILSYFNKIFHQ